MSKYYDASLVQIPSGYKAGTLYSVLPANGDGDFDFTRASIATRVNAEGLIETVASGVPRLDYPVLNGVVQSCPALLLEPARTNLALYSEELDNAYWTKSRVTISANTSGTTDPSGNNNADLVTQDAADTNGGVVLRSLTFTAASHTFSVFAKMNEVRYINLAENVSAGSTRRTWFDLQSGAVGTTNAGHTAKIENYGNGWYRCSITFTALAIANSVFVYLSDADSSTTAVVSKGSYLYGIQLEAGSYATSYIPTSGTTVARAADVCNGAGTSAEFNDSEGVLFAEVAMLTSNPSDSTFQIDDGTFTNRVRIRFTSTTNQINGLLYDGSAGQPNINFTANNVTISNKVAVVYQVNQIDLYVNGFKVGTSTGVAAPSGFNNFSLGTEGKAKQLIAFDAALTDEELEDLTSWDSFEEMAASQFYTLY
jgi:hypothetical protein